MALLEHLHISKIDAILDTQQEYDLVGVWLTEEVVNATVSIMDMYQKL